MKITQSLLLVAAISVGLFTATGANATLISALGGQVVNDTDLNVTWLANINLAATNTFGVSGIADGIQYPLQAGIMNLNTAQNWIGAMNAANYLGYHNWRLPTSDAACYGYNCAGSEMGHLFYNGLGGVAHQDLTTTHNDNYNLFQNFPSAYGSYWSSTVYAPAPSTELGFTFTGNYYVGFQDNFYNGASMYALAVRDGQVATVPVPAAAWLLGSGLLSLVGVALRKAA
ncbi:hypothetical protein SCD_n00775 [Sulfuricella denitrificans skB26]|uniref:Lcl C-terminal domain-containing protein n=1 Tax=Sulfuricella denitrificans (strain DSM 22764 / NBRC 105220 / skB26) TaxID=1163617 RepID=S6B1S0_SULDS|nr:DUF1566 domain-containing protein [Sulfuricella denitrificans]BAN34617.1 hypothetical protein SCD_n00775 [Sulfuricella denitrificans skB26]